MRTFWRFAIVSVVLLCGGCGASATAPTSVASRANRLSTLPDGWSVSRTVNVSAEQAQAIGTKLGGRIDTLDNVYLTVGGQPLQVNVVQCPDTQEAVRIQRALIRLHQNLHTACPRDGTTVYEFVYGDMRLVERAFQELNFAPRRVTYEVTFRAAPLESADYMLWNRLFNAFLGAEQDGGRRVAELAPRFRFGNRLSLRRHGQGPDADSRFEFQPPPQPAAAPEAAEIVSYSFESLPVALDVPQVGVTATIIAQDYALTPSRRTADRELLSPTRFWPSDDDEIVRLARQITGGRPTAEEKVELLLDWFRKPENLRFGGQVTGSRFGVKKVLEQRFGHCWDYSDLFITLCRAAGVPCRQVAGWLHGQQGHIWAEVLSEGAGWRMLDPTSGSACDSRYIAYLTSEDGELPLVYTSNVTIRVKQSSW